MNVMNKLVSCMHAPHLGHEWAKPRSEKTSLMHVPV